MLVFLSLSILDCKGEGAGVLPWRRLGLGWAGEVRQDVLLRKEWRLGFKR